MLTPGNKKLGADLIWGFGLPSGRADVCVGMTPTCRRVCYSRRTEQYRVRAAKQYERNLRFTRKKDFVRRVRAFQIAHHVRVGRIHSGGESASARYARKWMKIIRRSPCVRFFTYTGAWSIPAIHEVLAAMAALPNCAALLLEIAPLTVVPRPSPFARLKSFLRSLPAKAAAALKSTRQCLAEGYAAGRYRAAHWTLLSLPVKSIVDVSLMVGVAVATISFAAPHPIVAAMSGIGVSRTAMAVQAVNWVRRRRAMRGLI